MSFRNSMFWMHLSIGIAVGIIVLIMAVTGTMLAFRSQIIDFFERDVRRVSVPQETKRLSLDAITAQALKTKPGSSVTAVTVKADPHASVLVSFNRDNGALYIDPYKGTVLGAPSHVEEFMERVEVWHRWLGMEGKLRAVGRQVKGVATIAFLIMVISGFYLWWPKQWSWPGIKNIVLFNPQAVGKARDWNWHNVIGLWCAPVLIVIILTGLVMIYPWANRLLFKIAGSQPPAAAEKMGGQMNASELSGIDLEKFLTAAQHQEPDWKTITVRPGKPGAPVTVMIQEKNSPYPTPKSVLKLDATTAEVKSWEPSSGQDRGRRWRLFARYLHTGEVYGVIGQALAFTAALGATFLVWTGFAMAWRRFFSKKLV